MQVKKAVKTATEIKIIDLSLCNKDIIDPSLYNIDRKGRQTVAGSSGFLGLQHFM
jgi:hypothetical protein